MILCPFGMGVIMLQDLPNPPPPNAHRFQLSRIIQSVCGHCSKTIGYSPKAEILAIVERLHKCPVLRKQACHPKFES